jgi:hypothetical protein
MAKFPRLDQILRTIGLLIMGLGGACLTFASASRAAVALCAIFTSEDPAWIHATYLNSSGAARDYMYGLQSYHNNQHYYRPLSSIPDTVIWKHCGVSDNWLAFLASSSTGDFDGIGTFLAAYTRPGLNPPFTHARTFTWNQFLDWRDLSSVRSMDACYGTKIDAESLVDVRLKENLCLIRFTSDNGSCAPGWSTSLYEAYFCYEFTKCRDELLQNSPQWDNIGGYESDSEDSGLTLPEGWDKFDVAVAQIKANALAEVNLRLLTQPYCWAGINATLAPVAGIGAILIAISVVSSFVFPSVKKDESSERSSTIRVSVSDATGF